jgi:hypothetical protein
MEKWTRLSAEQRDNLVAYLDGELEDNETQHIDQVLAKSEVARHEVEALARTWELLDLLPKPEAPENFTERTLTTLKVSEVRKRMADQPWFGYVRKGSIGAVWAAGLAVCAVLGFVITSRWVPNEQTKLLADLPLLLHLDIYLEVRDLDFVKQLQRQGVFNVDDAETADAPLRHLDVSSGHSTDRALLAQRHDAIVKLPASERQRIQSNWNTFAALAPEQQAGLRALQEQLVQEPVTVQALLETYAMWLQTLSPGQRDDLRQAANNADRLKLVRTYRDQQEASRETQVFDLNLDLQRMKPRLPRPPYLSEKDLAAAMEVIQNLLPTQQQQIVQSKKTQTERYIEIFKYFTPNLRLTDEQWTNIIEVVGDEEQRSYMKPRAPLEQHMFLIMLLHRGMSAHVIAQLEPHYPTEPQLREFFSNLTSERREELLNLRSDKLSRELLSEYFEEKEAHDPQLKQLREMASRFRDFQGGPGGFKGGEGFRYSGFRNRPPGDRSGDDRDPPPQRRPDGQPFERPQPPSDIKPPF